MEKRTALIIGASGLVGGHCLGLLLDNSHYTAVTILVRRELEMKNEKLKQVIIDFDRIDDYADKISADDIYCCLGTTSSKAANRDAYHKVDVIYPTEIGRIGKQNGVKQYLIVSAVGANAKSWNYYLRFKGEVESELAKLNFDALHLFRPSIITGVRGEQRIGERIGRAIFDFFSALMVGRLRKYRNIQGYAIARSMIYAALNGKKGKYIYHHRDMMSMNK
ncbi:MAG: NAD(P)H-binding protein [Bacteroidetes bacterium]|nr:NAD(P)H-binding protein [Bacteroidota bacterium]